MRVLLASDLHYRLPQLDWVASVADRYDLVVLAGDHVDVAGHVEPGTQLVALTVTLADIAARTRLAACSGNHDLDGRNDAGEKSALWLAQLRDAGAAVDGDTLRLGEVTVTVLGWWDGPVARAQVEAQLDAARPASGRWLWVHHAPPEGRLSWTGHRHFGDPHLQTWVERHRPTGVLTGHIHQAPFTADGSWIDHIGDTWLLNAGQQPGPIPAHVDIDLDLGIAAWISLEGIDERRLAPAPEDVVQ